MATIKLCLLLILAVTCVRAQDGTDVSEELEAMPGTSFVYLPASSNAVLGAGESQRRTAREWPALDGMQNLGVSMTSFELAPCAVRQPHIHQYASGMLYVIQADSLVVGFVQENGTSVQNSISTGASAVFPQGLVHYQFNNGCTNATYTIAYNDPQGSTVNIVPALFDLPKAVVMAALNISSAQYLEMKNNVPTTNFVVGITECMSRCLITPQSVSGRKLMDAN